VCHPRGESNNSLTSVPISATHQTGQVIPRYPREYTTTELVNAFTSIWARDTRATGLIERWLSPSSVYFVGSGRECLYLLLRILPLPPHARVGVPLYCCMAVFDAIVAAGCSPVFIDIDLDTYSISAEHLSRVAGLLDALIVVHTFGYPANLDKIRAAIGARHIPVIEDCAHSLFSEYKGLPTGTLTEASFFSFGRHKPVAIGSGGMLVINDPHLAAAADKKLRTLPFASRTGELRAAVRSWLMSLIYTSSVYRFSYTSKILERHDRPFDGNYAAPAATVRGCWQPKFMLPGVKRLLEMRFGMFRRQLDKLGRHAAELQQVLNGVDLGAISEPPWGRWNHFLWPIRYRNVEQRRRARAILFRHGVDTSVLYQNCAYHARQFGYTSGCDVAERAAQTVCIVPHYSCLSEGDLLLIAEQVRSSVLLASS